MLDCLCNVHSVWGVTWANSKSLFGFIAWWFKVCVVIELVNKQGSSILSVWVPLLNKRYGSHGTNNSTWCTFCWSFPKHQFPSQTIMGPLCINFFSISFQQKDEGVCQIIQKLCRLFRELLFSMGTQSISQSI